MSEIDRAVTLAEKHTQSIVRLPNNNGTVLFTFPELTAMLAERDQQHTAELAQRSVKMPPKSATITMLSDMQSGTMQVMHEDAAEQWVREAIASMQAQIEILENKLALAEESGKELSRNYILRGERLEQSEARVAELENELKVALSNHDNHE